MNSCVFYNFAVIDQIIARSRSIIPNISREPVSGCPGKPSRARKLGPVSKPNASARMTLLFEAGHLIYPSLQGRGKGEVSRKLSVGNCRIN